MVKAPNLLGVHPTPMSYVYKVFQHLDMLWMGIWVNPYSVMPVQVRVDFLKIELSPSPSVILMSWLRLQTHLESIPHPLSISYVYKVFQHLDMLLMGTWVRPYTVMPV